MAVKKKSKTEIPIKTGGKFPFPVKDIVLCTDQIYKSNPTIKAANVETDDLTFEHITEFARCANDIVYFLQTYGRIITLDHGIQPFDPFEFQKEMLEIFKGNRFVLCNLARQLGKTTIVAGYIVWLSIFHNEQTICVMANKLEQAIEVMDRIRLLFENLPFFLQPGVSLYNRKTIKFDNDSTIFCTGGSGPRGRSLNCLYLDEAAFLTNDFSMYETIFPTLSSGEDTQLIMTSTPNGQRGLFYSLWCEALKGKNSYVTCKYRWDAHPKRDEKWKETTVRDIGYSRFRQEFEVEFRGSAGALIDTAIYELIEAAESMETDDPDTFRIYHNPEPDHSYVALCDCAGGVGQDFSTVVVVDVTTKPYRVAMVYANNTISPLMFPFVIENISKRYNEALAIVESNNDMGGQVSYILYNELEYENTLTTSRDKKGLEIRVGGKGAIAGVKMTRKVKSAGCSNLKAMVENGLLVLNDMGIIQELGTFIANSVNYEADEGCHDDLVMPLVMFGWFVKQPAFAYITGNDSGDTLSTSIRDAMAAVEADNILPFLTYEDLNEPELVDDVAYGAIREVVTSSIDDWFNS